MMKIEKTLLNNCYILTPNIKIDKRGEFIKTFHINFFEEYGLETKFKEQYYSVSNKGVLRGLHFQLPPFEHVKLVYCSYGSVLDAVVDLRKNSPTYGRYELFNLSQKNGKILYIPSGLAHGFYVTSNKAILNYNVSSVYSAEHDTGIRWDTVGIDWPNKNPILSERDSKLISFSDLDSPF